MKNSSLPTLPARFETRKGKSFWKCGVICCEGRLAEVVSHLDGGEEPGEAGYDGPFLWLRDNFERRPDGSYAKTKRSAQHSEVAKPHRADARHFLQTPDHLFILMVNGRAPDADDKVMQMDLKRAHLRQQIQLTRRRNQHRTFVLSNAEIQAQPAQVRCPGCGRCSIIKSVTGSSP
jgi:hypothetical protein